MNSLQKVDINCDLGEYYGNAKASVDHLIMPHISSCNIACGFHSGDPFTIHKTILLAHIHDVSIGAHPSFPDLQGFGRRNIEMDSQELKQTLIYQISAVKGMVESEGSKLRHVKPHGALYNMASNHSNYANAIIEAIQSVDDTLILFGLSGSLITEIAKEKGISFRHEAFIDRKYEDNLTLRNRQHNDAILDTQDAIDQLELLVTKQSVKTYSNQEKPIDVDTICIHSDTPDAVIMASLISKHLHNLNIEITTH